MSDDVARHYEQLLAEHYTWMLGLPFEAKAEEQRALLEELGVRGSPGGVAIDLGCGPGFQSIALADLGFAKVLAVDTSERLLAELEARKGCRPIQAVRADMREVARLVGSGGAELVACMGDTLTHLPRPADVGRLFADARSVLAPGGLIILTFRDLSTELTGLDRFVPVRSDADRVMTCFLEYEQEAVVVHDLINLRTEAGWTLRKSSYRKLRLSPDKVASDLAAAGFTVRRSEPAGRLWAIVAAG